MTKEKIQKVLQAAGIDSRRNIRQNIHDGLIQVNNKTVTDPNFLVDITTDSIKVDGRRIKIKIEKKSYFILNKPYGVVSTLYDPEGRSTVKDFISGIKERVYPVGRLDYHSEGLILLTNDGDLTNFVISSRNKIPKVYMIKVKGMISEETLKELVSKGIFMDDRRIKPMEVEYLRKTAQKNSWYRVTIVEGKKHVVRNIFKYLGHPVEKLKRLAIGSIQLKKLPTGHWRELTEEEITEFKKSSKYTPEKALPEKSQNATKFHRKNVK